jgi:uncharacterized membrane protein required for colicin V production
MTLGLVPASAFVATERGLSRAALFFASALTGFYVESAFADSIADNFSGSALSPL